MATLTPFQGNVLKQVTRELNCKVWYICLSHSDREHVAMKCYKALYHELRSRPNPVRISVRNFVAEWGEE